MNEIGLLTGLRTTAYGKEALPTSAVSAHRESTST